MQHLGFVSVFYVYLCVFRRACSMYVLGASIGQVTLRSLQQEALRWLTPGEFAGLVVL